MSLFITNSSCGGCRPSHLGSGQYHPRAALLAQMLRKRLSARFLVAPPGFGKTALLLEYAHSIFSFCETYWIRAQSPNFIRDLDDGVIISGIIEGDSKAGLVVFENVPRLNAKRASDFSAILDDLMAQGWEVVVSMTPASDVFQKLQSDRALIEAQDFLATDDEIIQTLSEAELTQRPPELMKPFERIPCIVWSDGLPVTQSYKIFFEEEIPPETLLPIFVMLVFGSGTLETVLSFLPTKRIESLASLERMYVYLGLNMQEGRFETCTCDPQDLARRFLPQISLLAEESAYSSKDALVMHLIDALVEKHDPVRACQFARTLATVPQRKTWLSKQGRALFEQHCFYEAHLVYDSLGISRLRNAGDLAADQLWRLHYLGNSEEGLRLAGRVAHMSSAGERERGIALLFVAQYGSTETMKDQALERLDEMLHYSASLETRTLEETLDWLGSEKRESWQRMGLGLLCFRENIKSALSFVTSSSFDADDIVPILARIFEATIQSVERKSLVKKEGFWYRELVLRAVDILGWLEKEEDLSRPSFSQLLLLRMIQPMMTLCGPHTTFRIPASSNVVISAIEANLFEQERDYGLHLKTKELRASRIAQGPSHSIESEGAIIPPVLSIKLFGSIEVTIGEQRVSPKQLTRQKDRVMLAILVLNKGKEMARDRLIASIWPDASPETGLRNFYGVWSRLVNALQLSNGQCPYLIRMQYSCKIDSQLVRSDVSRFEEICRKVSFGATNIDAWEQYYEQLSTTYTDDLLPGEYENEIILSLRDEYRDRMVDACVTSANQLIQKARPKAALWFARLALERDKTREDAYEALMRSQLEAGQRSAALGTFFKCRGFLVEELGLDPSAEIMALYNGIIAEDPTCIERSSKRLSGIQLQDMK